MHVADQVDSILLYMKQEANALAVCGRVPFGKLNSALFSAALS